MAGGTAPYSWSVVEGIGNCTLLSNAGQQVTLNGVNIGTCRISVRDSFGAVDYSERITVSSRPCEIKTSCDIIAEPCFLSLSGLTDAHTSVSCPKAGFGYELCCPNSYTIDPGCQAGVISLSDSIDAHTSVYNVGSFNTDVCVKAANPTKTASCRYITSGNCNYDETCFVSLTNTTDAHIGGCSDYSTKVCCKV